MAFFAISCALAGGYAVIYTVHAAKRRHTAAAWGAALLALWSVGVACLCLLF